MPIINVEQGSEEWKVLRGTKITSTMASSIMGCNPFKSKLQLFNELVGLVEPDETTERMKKGTELEPIARNLYMDKTGIDVKPIVYVSDSHPWALASLDGVNYLGTVGLEIKCGKRAFEQATYAHIPEYYICQMQFAMWVTNIPKMHYFCFWEGESMLMSVERDNEYIDAIQKECEKFYNDLQVLKAPEIDPFEDIGISDEEWNKRTEQTWKEVLKEETPNA